MALPSRKLSRSRRGKRRSQQRVKVPSLSLCPQCNEPKLPHHVCPNCGHYKGRTVIETEEV